MKFFDKNESKSDRIVRAVVGLVLLAAFLLYSPSPISMAEQVLSVVMAIVAAVLLVTAATGSCLVYTMAGWNTLKKGKAPAKKAKAKAKKRRR